MNNKCGQIKLKNIFLDKLGVQRQKELRLYKLKGLEVIMLTILDGHNQETGRKYSKSFMVDKNNLQILKKWLDDVEINV